MKKIELKRLHLVNFKGVAEATYDFGETTEILGANGTGKSTIYEAYLWVLFDKNPYGGKPSVRPLDKDNNSNRDIVTEVEAVITADGLPFKVKRTQEEKWTKVRGTGELVCSGLTNTKFFNDVPMADKDYAAKLADIANVDDWFMLSSISIILGMKQDERRRKLQSIAPAFDENALMALYPAILKAKAEHKSADELKVQVLTEKKKSTELLNMIPARIDEQERSRVDIDFEFLEDEKKKSMEALAQLEAEEAEIQKGYVVESSLTLQTESRQLTAQICAEEESIRDEHMKRKASLTGEIAQLESGIRSDEFKISMAQTDIANIKQQLAENKDKIADLRVKYTETSKTEYQPTHQISTVCPTCGQSLPADKVEAAKAKDYEVWNTRKAETLKDYVKQAEQIKARVLELEKELAYQQELLSEREVSVKTSMESVAKLREKEVILQPRDYSDEVKAAIARREEIADEIEAMKKNAEDANAEANQRLAEIRGRKQVRQHNIDAINEKLALSGTNKRIDERIAELREEQTKLAQAVADADNVLAQIASYKKKRIDEVEKAVSSLFKMVRWKMYQPNVSNDGEQEICQAIIDGVPYEQQNRATQMNAAVDVINGFSAGLGLNVPLFFDNKESVSDLIETEMQIITMTVIPYMELTINLL